MVPSSSSNKAKEAVGAKSDYLEAPFDHPYSSYATDGFQLKKPDSSNLGSSLSYHQQLDQQLVELYVSF
ncbi:hypothetical protein Tco_0293514, partial [Tanacetum coccineum]